MKSLCVRGVRNPNTKHYPIIPEYLRQVNGHNSEDMTFWDACTPHPQLIWYPCEDSMFFLCIRVHFSLQQSKTPGLVPQFFCKAKVPSGGEIPRFGLLGLHTPRISFWEASLSNLVRLAMVPCGTGGCRLAVRKEYLALAQESQK